MSSTRKRRVRLASGNRLRAAAEDAEAVAAAGDAEAAAEAADAEAAEAAEAAAAAAAAVVGSGVLVPFAEIASFNCARHPRA